MEKKLKRINPRIAANVAGITAGVLIGGAIMTGGVRGGTAIDENINPEGRIERGYQAEYNIQRDDFQIRFIEQRAMSQVSSDIVFEDAWTEVAENTSEERMQLAKSRARLGIAGASVGAAVGLVGGMFGGAFAGVNVHDVTARKVNNFNSKQEEKFKANNPKFKQPDENVK